MTIYLVNIFLITIYAIFLIYSKNATESSKRFFIILASAQWILLSGLRATSVGADALAYKYSFLKSQARTWESLFIDFKEILFLGKEGKDPGYPIFEKLCGYITQNYQVYLLIIAIIFFVAMGYSIYKNSSDPYISFLIFSCLFYAFFAITGHRQTIATALVVFIGYEFIKKRKLLPFVAIVLVAATIHKSSLIFLIMYPLYRLNPSKKVMIIGLIAIIFAFCFNSFLSSLFTEISGYDYDIYKGETANTFIFLLCAVTAFSFVRRNELTNPMIVSEATPHYIIAILVATFFCPLIILNPSAMRVVQYFSVFIMFLIPEYIAVFSEENRKIAWLIFVGAILLLFIKNHPVYLFFWQVPTS